MKTVSVTHRLSGVLSSESARSHFQERSRIAVISAVLSSTDQLTSRLTPASTQERSHTNVRRVELVLYR